MGRPKFSLRHRLDNIYLVVRAVSVSIRVIFPVLVLLIASQEELGRYYLYASAIAFIIFASTFESGTYFAKKYLRRSDEATSLTYLWQIVHVQIIFMILLGAPILAFIIHWLGDFRVGFYAAIIFYLFTEVVVNEFGRYLTNINKVKAVALRDLYRAVAFLGAGFLSLLAAGAVVAWQYFIAFGTFNLILAIADLARHRRFSRPGERAWRRGRIYPAALFRSVVGNARGLIAQAGLGYAYPLLERILLERTLGLGAVGGYALLISVFQSFNAVMFLPHIAKMRSVLLAPVRHARISAGLPGLRSFVIYNLLCGIVIIAVSQIAVILFSNYPIVRKVDLSIGFSFAALLFIIAGSVITIVSPDYAGKGNLLKSTLVTVAIYGVSLALFWVASQFLSGNHILLAAILSGGFIAQLLARHKYFERQSAVHYPSDR